jgi:hypothetical protein
LLRLGRPTRHSSLDRNTSQRTCQHTRTLLTQLSEPLTTPRHLHTTPTLWRFGVSGTNATTNRRARYRLLF